MSEKSVKPMHMLYTTTYSSYTLIFKTTNIQNIMNKEMMYSYNL